MNDNCTTTATTTVANSNNNKTEEQEQLILPAIIGTIILVIVIVTVVLVILICCKRKQQREADIPTDVNPVYEGAADYDYDEMNYDTMGNEESVKVALKKKEVFCITLSFLSTFSGFVSMYQTR